MRILVISCLLAAALVVPASAKPSAVKTCHVPKYPSHGYFTSLKVTKTTCTTGRKLALAYFKCRTKHGLKGRCTSKVMGYACSEKRMSIPTEIDARVTCKSGSKKIVHSYQQDT
jgi:hypothetical protein